MNSARTVLASASLSAITPSKSKINALNLKPQRKSMDPAIAHRRAFHPWAGAVVAEQILFHVMSTGAKSISRIPRHQAAVHRDDRAGQEGSRGQAEAQRHVGDLLGVAVASAVRRRA